MSCIAPVKVDSCITHSLCFLVHRYVRECEAANEEPKPRGKYHLIQPSCSPQQLKKKLLELKDKGVIKSPPEVLLHFHRRRLVAYQTEAVILVHAMSMPCYQAALVQATGCSLTELGAIV